MLAAAAIQWVAGPAEATGLSVLVIVALLSLAASGQTSLAVTVGLAELNTTMVTGAMVGTTPGLQTSPMATDLGLDLHLE